MVFIYLTFTLKTYTGGLNAFTDRPLAGDTVTRRFYKITEYRRRISGHVQFAYA